VVDGISSSSTCQGLKETSVPVAIETIRKHAMSMLGAIGISRIIVVDDEYSEGNLDVEELLGLCTVLDPEDAVKVPCFGEIDFATDREIWADAVRRKWEDLGRVARQEALAFAHSLVAADVTPELNSGKEEQSRGLGINIEEEPDASHTPPAGDVEIEERAEQAVPLAGGSAGVVPAPNDSRAAESLEEVLAGLDGCAFVNLSLLQWREQAERLLADSMASTTVFLFDRNFDHEQPGTENEGLNLVREVQGRGIGYCGLISHTVLLGEEHDSWRRLAEEYGLTRDKFVVIAKARLTGEYQDHYSFLRMLRLVALSGRYTHVKTTAWTLFEESVSVARTAIDRLSPLEFDQIVFASSRREGVWEPDTLFRVFGIFMRHAARARLYLDREFSAIVNEARRVSAVSEEVAASLGEERASKEALLIQRFETYELDETLNRFCLPLDLGDVFERESNCRQYILLAQPCELMVRGNGKRSYEDEKLGRTGALVELTVDRTGEDDKERWAELSFFDRVTGAKIYADFAKAYQVKLAVLDLCALRTDGVATVDKDGECPGVVIESWARRYERLQKYFSAAFGRYEELAERGVKNELKALALPTLSETLRVSSSFDGSTLRYDLKRVMRLRQPRSGALLTAFAQYHARAAFEHPFDHRVPMPVELNTDGCAGEDEGPDDEV